MTFNVGTVHWLQPERGELWIFLSLYGLLNQGRHHTPQAILLGLEGELGLLIPLIYPLSDATQVPIQKQ